MSTKKAKQQLVNWCSQQVASYKDIQITNLTSSWKSGLAFCAILHHHDKNCIDFYSLSESNPEHNLQLAFDIAKKRFGIYPLLEVEDLTCDRPDWKSIFTYVSEIRRELQGHVPTATSSATTKVTKSPAKSTKKAKEIPPAKRTESELKKAMGKAMERVRKQKKTTALIRANKEGRKMEFLFPYLEEKGWTYEILTNMGVQINLDLVDGNRKKNPAPVKQPVQEINSMPTSSPPKNSVRSPPPGKPLPIKNEYKNQKFILSSRSTAAISQPELEADPFALTIDSIDSAMVPAPQESKKMYLSSKSSVRLSAHFPDSTPVAGAGVKSGQVQFGGAWYAATLEASTTNPGYYRATISKSNAAIQQNLVDMTITVPEDRVYIETQLKKAFTRVASSYLDLSEDISEKTKGLVASVSGYFQLFE